MSTQDFLVELGTEELPPKALKALSKAFADNLQQSLQQENLSCGAIERFASPRRLAVRIKGLAETQADIAIEKRGPAKKAAYDAEGQPTKALQGFARSCGTEPEQLETLTTDKGEWLIYRSTQAGKSAAELMPLLVNQAIQQLPIPKRMRWGAQRTEFVRPVHWLLMLLGSQTVAAEVLGLKAGNTTRGHRFHADQTFTIESPADYEKVLREAFVVASFEDRRDSIEQQVKTAASKAGGQAVISPALLDEVTALNEWPVALVGRFEERFLEVPREALVSSMEEHQKYFHMIDTNGDILPNFITIANIESKDPQAVIEGNERVIRPRLSDAAFFYNLDRKTTLAARRESLRTVVFQQQLGTVFEKTERVGALAAFIATKLGADPDVAKRAGELSKSDLVSEMVLEFTDLQGIMGRYYALHDGEPAELAEAMLEQYLPKHAGGTLPQSNIGCALSIAEKLDSLIGLFGIKQPPTGTKDPFGLRRASLGVLRIIVERQLSIDLEECLQKAFSLYTDVLSNDQAVDQVLDYMLDRFRSWYEEEGIAAEVFLAVHARRPTRPLDFHKRIGAVSEFIKLPASQSLAGANKRVSNLLAKSNAEDIPDNIDAQQFELDAERSLYETMQQLSKRTRPLFESGDYQSGLCQLAELSDSVNRFFDDVMVMVDDNALRLNRLALLAQLRNLFLNVADISLLPSQSTG